MFSRLMRYRHWLAIGAGVILGLVFIVSGVGKILAPDEFHDILLLSAPYLPEELALFIACWLPWVELVLGLLLLLGISAKLAAGVSLLLVAGFIFHNTWVIVYALELDSCGCLGVLEKGFQIAMSVKAARYLDIGMLVLGLIIVFCYPGRFFTFQPWFLKKR